MPFPRMGAGLSTKTRFRWEKTFENAIFENGKQRIKLLFDDELKLCFSSKPEKADYVQKSFLWLRTRIPEAPTSTTVRRVGSKRRGDLFDKQTMVVIREGGGVPYPSGFLGIYNPAVTGLNLKHTIYMFHPFIVKYLSLAQSGHTACYQWSTIYQGVHLSQELAWSYFCVGRMR